MAFLTFDIGVLVIVGGAGAIGTLFDGVDVTGGGATADSVKGIGVGVSSVRSRLSDFNKVPFIVIGNGGGASST